MNVPNLLRVRNSRRFWEIDPEFLHTFDGFFWGGRGVLITMHGRSRMTCLLYTSDAADE